MLLFTAGFVWGVLLGFPSSLTHFDGQQDVAEESSVVQKMGDQFQGSVLRNRPQPAGKDGSMDTSGVPGCYNTCQTALVTLPTIQSAPTSLVSSKSASCTSPAINSFILKAF